MIQMHYIPAPLLSSQVANRPRPALFRCPEVGDPWDRTVLKWFCGSNSSPHLCDWRSRDSARGTGHVFPTQT